MRIIRQALEAPLRQLADNIGSPGRYIVQETSRLTGRMGFNVTTRRYEDLLKSDVVDALKVTWSALENAASVATLLVLTEALVTESSTHHQSSKLTAQVGMQDARNSTTTICMAKNRIEIETETEKRPRLPHSILSGVQIEFVVGDITQQPDVQAIVNAANARLLPGSGVAGAIHHAAGSSLVAECLPLAPIRPGEAVLTGGYALPNPHVIHCLGPIYGEDEPAAELLANCYRNALQLADKHGIESIAFPAISTGAFGYPFIEATEIACRAILETVPSLTHVKRIRLIFILAVKANIGCTLLNQRFEE